MTMQTTNAARAAGPQKPATRTATTKATANRIMIKSPRNKPTWPHTVLACNRVGLLVNGPRPSRVAAWRELARAFVWF